MVTYTEWTEIGHEVYKSKGGTYGNRRAAQSVTETLAAFWRENRDRLEPASRTEAREIARNSMTV